ncbi:MAG: undecaprenyl-phosphate glucose phosphotransferase [Lachnospiraceae bacterium]|nr:undecaprenyl-phosphate glucose phosphotransferase [Lachnospiraceae bacterium]
MIKDNQKYFNRLHIVMDAFVVAIAYALAWLLRFKSGYWPKEQGLVGILGADVYFSALIFIIPAYLILNQMFNLYTSKRYSSAKRDVVNVIKANIIGLFLFISVLYIIDQKHFSRGMIFVFCALNILGQSGTRLLIRKILRSFRKKGYNVKYVLLVGYSKAAEQYIDRIMQNPQWGYVVRGILDDHIPRGTLYRGIKVLGTIGNLDIILPDSKLDEIAITLSLKDYDMLERIVGLCEKSGVHTKFIPDYNSVIPSKPYTEDLNGLPVINIRHVPLSNTLNSMAKRIVDVFGSVFAIILFSPVFLIVAILIKCTSRGPIIFKQERVGLHNEPFNMYKFRTMEVQKPSKEKSKWTTKDDPRVTKVGRILRRTSIDELPQFFNVLKGDMSMVGPRPERPFFVEKFKEEIPRYMIKHQVRPGITGWAQINGYRGDTSIRRRIDCDLYYIENWTMGLDFKILFLTIFKGFINKNAY